MNGQLPFFDQLEEARWPLGIEKLGREEIGWQKVVGGLVVPIWVLCLRRGSCGLVPVEGIERAIGGKGREVTRVYYGGGWDDEAGQGGCSVQLTSPSENTGGRYCAVGTKANRTVTVRR